MPSSVLVVDDEPDLRFLIRMALESASFAVMEAANGAEALDRIASEVPDVLVTDLMMPRMSGRDLINCVRADPALDEVPILVLSASVVVSVPGVDQWMTKPFETGELVANVQRLVQARAGGA